MKTKGGKTMNPTDAYRKELRKKELKRNKKERKKVREVGILKKDPEAIKDQIKKLDTMNADGALDKTRRHKKRQLEDTLSLVIKKRKEYEDKMKEKGEDPVMFSHLPVPRRRTTAEEEQRTPLPEDSVYYHPTLNPTGHPPPGKPPMYKSSLGPRIPLSGDDLEGSLLLPPPPPPPPLPTSKEDTAGEEPLDPLRVPVPPPPPAPPRPPSSTSKPPPPPPPTGAPGLENVHVSIPAPPPPPPPRPLQPPPPGTNGEASPAEAKEESAKNVETASVTEPATASKSIDDFHDSEIDSEDVAALTRPSAPSPVMRLPSGPPQNSGIEVAPPGISRIAIPPAPSTRPPPPPPPRMPPPTMVPAMGMLPPIPPPQMSHFGFPPPGLPPVGMAYGVPPMPPRAWEGTGNGDYGKIAKPFYVKSAAPTVVKRPLAHHTPELTAMVPASVRVRRETSQKVKPRPAAAATAAPSTTARPTTVATKPPSIDDSYSAFLEDMKALGAFEGGMK